MKSHIGIFLIATILTFTSGGVHLPKQSFPGERQANPNGVELSDELGARPYGNQYEGPLGDNGGGRGSNGYSSRGNISNSLEGTGGYRKRIIEPIKRFVCSISLDKDINKSLGVIIRLIQDLLCSNGYYGGLIGMIVKFLRQLLGVGFFNVEIIYGELLQKILSLIGGGIGGYTSVKRNVNRTPQVRSGTLMDDIEGSSLPYWGKHHGGTRLVYRRGRIPQTRNARGIGMIRETPDGPVVIALGPVNGLKKGTSKEKKKENGFNLSSISELINSGCWKVEKTTDNKDNLLGSLGGKKETSKEKKKEKGTNLSSISGFISSRCGKRENRAHYFIKSIGPLNGGKKGTSKEKKKEKGFNLLSPTSEYGS